MATSIIKNSPFSYFTRAGVYATGTTFNLPNNYRGTLFIHDSTPANNGVYMVYATGAGAVSYKAISSASNVTLSDATNKLTITPSAGSRTVMFLNAQGNVTVQ